VQRTKWRGTGHVRSTSREVAGGGRIGLRLARALGDRLRTTRALVTILCVCLRRSRRGACVRLAISQIDRACCITVTDAGPTLSRDEVEVMLSPVLAIDGGLPTRDLSRALRAAVVQGGLVRVEPWGEGMAFTLELPTPPLR
jgi:hypothetical protein